MSSATSDVTYTSVYTDSEPGRAFWGADDEEVSEGGIPRVIVLGYDGLPLQPVAPPSPDFIPGPEDPQTPPVPQDEDEREPMFIQAHDPPLPPIDSPTTESPGYVTESDPEEDPEEYEDDETEDGPVDYPMDGGDDGDDDDGDSSRDDANDEDEDEEDEEDEEEEEHLAPADSTTVIPADEPVFPPEGTEPRAEVERLLTMTTPSPSPPISLSPPFAGERLASYYRITTTSTTTTTTISIHTTTHQPVDHRDDIPETEQSPRKRLHLSTLGSRYEVGESSTARPTRGQGIDYGFVSMIEHKTSMLLLEDAQDSRSRISQRVDMDFTAGSIYLWGIGWTLLGEVMIGGGGGLMLPARRWGSFDRIAQVHETRFQMQACGVCSTSRDDSLGAGTRCLRLPRSSDVMRREMNDMQMSCWHMRGRSRGGCFDLVNGQLRTLGPEGIGHEWGEVFKEKMSDQVLSQGEIQEIRIELGTEGQGERCSRITERLQELP
ncbi:hypothetical protein Tco_1122197 [Tanacetum coccineum]|uniref:Uncharacterized protein n=1 Tax=Tanacetum coccineum TaxID=301880 RepID=A0ABQ5IZY4_9ASTR